MVCRMLDRRVTQVSVENSRHSPHASTYVQLSDYITVLGSGTVTRLKIDAICAPGALYIKSPCLRSAQSYEFLPQLCASQDLVAVRTILRAQPRARDFVGVCYSNWSLGVRSSCRNRSRTINCNHGWLQGSSVGHRRELERRPESAD